MDDPVNHPSLDSDSWAHALPLNSPIETSSEITDNAMAVGLAIERLCDFLQIDVYDTKLYRAFQNLTDATTGIPVARFMHQTDVRPERYPEFVIFAWIKSDELPSNFRGELVALFEEIDDASSMISELSQSKWEKLRDWTNYHVA